MAHKSIDWEEIAAANDKAFNGAFGGEMPVKGSEKFWNSKGESVDTIEEAEAE